MWPRRRWKQVFAISQRAPSAPRDGLHADGFRSIPRRRVGRKDHGRIRLQVDDLRPSSSPLIGPYWTPLILIVIRQHRGRPHGCRRSLSSCTTPARRRHYATFIALYRDDGDDDLSRLFIPWCRRCRRRGMHHHTTIMHLILIMIGLMAQVNYRRKIARQH